MALMMDAEELYYELLDDAETRLGGDLSEAADEALAAAAQAQADEHNAHVCRRCSQSKSYRVTGGVCGDCRRSERAQNAAAELAQLEPKLAAMQARREELLRELDS